MLKQDVAEASRMTVKLPYESKNKMETQPLQKVEIESNAEDVTLGLELFCKKPWMLNLFPLLDIPHEVLAAFEGLDDWEYDASLACETLVYSQQNKVPVIDEMVAHSIGEMLTIQLIEGNYDAPRIVSEGLANLVAGKPFRPEAGRKLSKVGHLLVLGTFYFLKKNGNADPSQADVRENLAKSGYRFSSGQLSKIFHRLGLDAVAGDARSARKRKTQKGK